MGKITLNVALNRMIFTEGSTMIIDIQLVNESKKKVHELDVALVQYGSYKNKNMHKVGTGVGMITNDSEEEVYCT